MVLENIRHGEVKGARVRLLRTDAAQRARCYCVCCCSCEEEVSR